MKKCPYCGKPVEEGDTLCSFCLRNIPPEKAGVLIHMKIGLRSIIKDLDLPTCKYCGKSGFLLRISKDGLCDSCQAFIVLDVNNRFRIIKESIAIIQKSKNSGTINSRYQLAVDNLNTLLAYEEKGIPTIFPSPSVLLSTLNQDRDEALSRAAAPSISGKSKKI